MLLFLIIPLYAACVRSLEEKHTMIHLHSPLFLYMNINEKNTEINQDRKHNKGLNFANRLH